MSVTQDIVRMYRAPRDVLRRRMFGPEREDRALAILMAACVLIFVAQWPRLSREAFFDTTITFDARMAGALFGWVFIAPLFLYCLALAVHWGLRLLGSASTPFQSRMALFWSLLATTPLWLLSGLTSGFVGPSLALTTVGLLAFGAFLLFWGVGVSEIARVRKEDPA